MIKNIDKIYSDLTIEEKHMVNLLEAKREIRAWNRDIGSQKYTPQWLNKMRSAGGYASFVVEGLYVLLNLKQGSSVKKIAKEKKAPVKKIIEELRAFNGYVDCNPIIIHDDRRIELTEDIYFFESLLEFIEEFTDAYKKITEND